MVVPGILVAGSLLNEATRSVPVISPMLDADRWTHLGAFVIWVPAAAFLALAGDFASAANLAVWGTVVVGLVDNIVYPIFGRQ